MFFLNESPNDQPPQKKEPNSCCSGYLNQQLNFSLVQSLALPIFEVSIKDKKTLQLLTKAKNFQESKKELANFFRKNLNEEVAITSTEKENEIKVEFENESTLNYVYNSLKNELELLSLIDSNENSEAKEVFSESKTDSDSTQLKEIISKRQYKEYQPIKSRMSFYQKIKFSTNSMRDYQKKYVSQYFIQIENEKDFQVTKILIGNNGVLLRKIIFDNCIYYNDYSTKIRLRGKGSGYKEGPNNEESNDPLELCVSSLNLSSFVRCCFHIENILRSIYYQYYLHQCKANFFSHSNAVPVLKKIMKYQYVVNRTKSDA